MKIYVASSWRTDRQPEVVAALRDAGHTVYDFRHPAPGNNGFSWADTGLPSGPMTSSQTVSTLRDPRAESGFTFDMEALKWCDACVLVNPSGRSAHLELGYCVGAGKLTALLLLDGEPPDLMYKMVDYLCCDVESVITAFK